MLSPSQLNAILGAPSPPAQPFSGRSFGRTPDRFSVSDLDDEIVYTFGDAIWTSSEAHRRAGELVTGKETVFRQLIDGDRAWGFETGKHVSKFLAQKRSQQLDAFEARLVSTGIARNWITVDGGRKSLFGFRVRFDDRDVVMELSKLVSTWEIRSDGKPFQIGPVFLPGGVFDLVDYGVVVHTTVWIDGQPQLGTPPKDCSSEWIIRPKAFASTEDAVRYAVSAIAKESKR